MPDIWIFAGIAVKFTLYLSVLVAFGSVLCALVFKLAGYRKLAITFGLVGIFATIINFALRAAALTGDASGITDPEILKLLWGTPVGTALSYRVFGLMILVISLVIKPKVLALPVLGGSIAAWSFIQLGHIPEHNTMLLNILLFLHISFAALWIGILAPLRRLATTNDNHEDAVRVGRQFGIVATFTVPALIAIGSYMTYVLVGSLQAMFTTGYGQTLLAKIAIVSVLLALGALNKLRFIPALTRGERGAAKHLVRSISWEWIAVCFALLATAILTTVLPLPK